ncbi:conserved hypothetical protein [Sulfolobus islandicus Y.G.57.14]|jgi:hypothetical protein|uniref:Uncharacterized protein n=7 Tax=Saccharolobus islandicus TaxID=43080 RepID=C3MMP3_SACI2|nr:hypothetical protein [Sulfolobus islandicus]ACP36760.1 conserved hypothetical protein [Sulfolobus islandicus L.S.2.15]ACP39373.1 conserved hypothetical protein [Sulfolobus islandicus M.14.25]ACP47057.1 conserved hypothetical protein [Sulfolobus islandicus Y.G.57.14]ACP49913.1 conserved hypothetical protein [Sulfolobus islandicus Y.N.15.51]ACP56555.1 conserved hypothetical protein [Sulfolobus islandicus M.16.27]
MTNESIKYIAIKMLADKAYVVDAIYSYLVEGERPSVLAYKYGITKHTIRGNIMRFVEKASGEGKAKKLIALIKQSNAKVSPIVYKTDGMYTCLLCNEKLDEGKLEKHITTKHKAELQRAINYIMSKVEGKKKQEEANKKEVVVNA